ncbi:hypothetical protein PYW07_016438 [Mythimna separata]|uniref:HTH psq-type domain-containing protein n=1 Tax=Mythimna separata TaxID=271217 RepID=A0AAD7YKL4_MYTSE|nr:hypothetical protein PYW07_016438 [Mythimna separata]
MITLTGSVKLRSRRARGPTWSEKDLRAAVAAINEGRMNTKAAARRYRIPRTSLRHHVTTGTFVIGSGKKPVLTKTQEKQLVEKIKNLSSIGFPLTPKFIRKYAFDFCIENNIKNKFNISTGLAGFTWYQGFVARNPEIQPVKQ